ncbi:hypothetical protein TWF694_006836 [Orbilia ellipsospora]|uniref:Uncharacterized protein n=1 Tax=Orbilia ellipsospora TaxID=2528407 RepID=A0AAV9XLB6_9PEZI
MLFTRVFILLAAAAATALVLPLWYRLASQSTTGPQILTLSNPSSEFPDCILAGERPYHSCSRPNEEMPTSVSSASHMLVSLPEFTRIRPPEATVGSHLPGTISLPPSSPIHPKTKIPNLPAAASVIMVKGVDLNSWQSGHPKINQTDIDAIYFSDTPPGAKNNDFKKNIIRL